jgi:Nuclease-related domain
MKEKAESIGTAGGSARREGERRRRNRERRTREKHPRIGGALVALQKEPQHERAWASGAEGEEVVATTLEERCAASVCLLHDRRIPGSRANIDHLAVTPTGVWVIDTKKYKGKAEVRKPLFGQAKLLINGRDKSKLAEGLAKQVALVEAVVDAGVPVHGAFCLVDADLPLFGTLTFRGYRLLYRKALAKRLNATGPLTAETVREIAAVLAARFPDA